MGAIVFISEFGEVVGISSGGVLGLHSVNIFKLKIYSIRDTAYKMKMGQSSSLSILARSYRMFRD